VIKAGKNMYKISVDRDRNLVRAELGGFFIVAEVQAFAREEQAAVESLGCIPGQHRVLIDASQCVLQAQDVVTAFAQMVSASPVQARRIAVVAQGSLYRMQTRRILDTDRSAMFETSAEAEAWIAQDERAFGTDAAMKAECRDPA
jgi:hypothetical protein